MESFARTYAADGWRYGVAYRTRPDSVDGVVGWPVQRWNGERWITIATGTSYEDARRIATEYTAATPWPPPTRPRTTR